MTELIKNLINQQSLVQSFFAGQCSLHRLFNQSEEQVSNLLFLYSIFKTRIDKQDESIDPLTLFSHPAFAIEMKGK